MRAADITQTSFAQFSAKLWWHNEIGMSSIDWNVWAVYYWTCWPRQIETKILIKLIIHFFRNKFWSKLRTYVQSSSQNKFLSTLYNGNSVSIAGEATKISIVATKTESKKYNLAIVCRMFKINWVLNADTHTFLYIFFVFRIMEF